MAIFKIYQFAQNYDNAAGLLALAPQPRCDGIQYPRTRRAGNGDTYKDGAPYFELEYSVLTHEEYSDLLIAFGLNGDSETAAGTFRGPDRVWQAQNYNVKIHRPSPQSRMGWFRNVVFLITDTEEL